MKLRTHVTAAVVLFMLVNLLYPVTSIIRGALLAGAAGTVPDLLDYLTGRHRGIGHTLLILPPLLLYSLKSPENGIPLLAGITSHILLDLFTVHGCPLLYPLKDTPYHCLQRKKRIKTGTAGEWALLSFLIAITVVTSLVSVGAPGDALHPQIRNSSRDGQCRTMTVNIQVDADRDVNVTSYHTNGSESILVDFRDD